MLLEEAAAVGPSRYTVNPVVLHALCGPAQSGTVSQFAHLHFPPEAVDVGRDEVDALPPSCRTVFRVVREHGPVTHQDLRQATGMPPRTIRFALSRLREERILDMVSSLKDSRAHHFFIHKSRIKRAYLEAERRKAAQEEAEGRLVERRQGGAQPAGLARSGPGR